MSAWGAVAAAADAAVEAAWGEPLVLRPWSKEEFIDGAPDTSRPIVTTTGLFFEKAAMVTGPGFLGRGGQNTAMSGRVVEADVFVSIRQGPVTQAKLQQGDRIEVSERGQTFEVVYIMPSATGRPIIPLLRVKDG